MQHHCVRPSLLAIAQHLTGPCRAGLLLATGGDDNLVKVWRADRDQALHTLEGHTREVSCVRWSPSGAGTRQNTLISTSYDNTARCAICSGDCARWWPSPSSPARGWSLQHAQGCCCCAGWLTVQRAHQTRYAAAHVRVQMSMSCRCRVWDADRGVCLQEFTGHSAPVMCVAFSPDGMLAASGSDDEHVRVWSVQHGKQLKRYKGRGSCMSVSWSSKHDKIAAAFQQWSTLPVLTLKR